MIKTRLFPGIRAAAVVAACFILAKPAAPEAGISVPAFRPVLGVEFREVPAAGPEILRVSPNSPAALADLQPGDKILAVDGKKIKNVPAAAEAIVSHPPYDVVEITLDRKGERLTRKIVLGGKMRLEDMPVDRLFPIPGIETAAETAPPGAVEALDRINVLKRVVISAQDGTIEFIGTYDPHYATGPLPYRELLADGLLHPEPAFTFGEPRPGMLDEVDKLYAKKEADIESFNGPEGGRNFASWLRRWMNLVTGHPLLENERQIYLARHAAVSGLTKSELALISNYVTLHGAMNPVPKDILELQLKILRNLGFGQEAPAYALYRDGTSRSLAEASKMLGIYERVRTMLEPLVSARKSNAEMEEAIRAFVCCELMARLNQVSRAQAEASWRDFQQGKIKAGGLDSSLQIRIVPERDRAGHPLVYQAINRMPLSYELLRLFYDAKRPVIDLVFKDVPPASHLGRVLYKADYVLKTIDNTEEIVSMVPGHKSFREIAGSNDFGRNIQFRYELRPLEVPIFVSDDRSEVGFGNPLITIHPEAAQFPGRIDVPPAEAAAAQTAAEVYARQIPDRYEEYARAYPPLHELREAAKIIALVKWLNRENITVQPGGSGAVAWNPPKEVAWLYKIYMSFEFPPEGSGKKEGVFLMPLSVSGGATFKIKKNWAVFGPKPPDYSPAAESLATSAALGEQAVKAALGGNLESARALAELGAQAMSGDLDRSRLPANVFLPKGPQHSVTPEEVRLVKEAIKTIRAASSESSPDATAGRTALIRDAGDALRAAGSGPAAASDSLKRLQTRALGPPSSEGNPVAEPDRSATAGAPAPFDCAALTESLSDGADLGDQREALLAAKISEIQKRLEVIRKAMEKLNRLQAGDAAALREQEAEISEAYEAAQERALDAMAMFLVDGPLEILSQRRAAIKKALDSDITGTLLVKNITLKADDIARLDRRGFDLYRMKYAYENIYGRAERMQKTLTGAKSLYDMSSWADSDRDDFDKLKYGVQQLVETVLADEKLGSALKIGKLTGEAALRFISLYKATDTAWGFFYDIMRQKLVWEPLVDELTKSLETNRRAVLTLQEKARDLNTRLNCLHGSLNK